ncbi:CDP-diacylglycerol--serine O-phosphatidyltransferase [Sorangium sp. So ce315]|uniref:CDP-diacylglycerol--serine O-phosphatidyltransferase n=1 Tax=Sorangium sp. So ce315 TaxID=3133299 RepID=UPI003F5E231B
MSRRTLVLIPSLITLSSVFCGFDAVRRAASARSDEDLRRAALLVLVAMVLDALDGRVARMTRTQSAFGRELDSLADLVSFGVAPAVLVYQCTLHRLGLAGVLGGFVFTACGAIRLARFNVLAIRDAVRAAPPPRYIVGLPVTGGAGVLVAIVMTDGAAGGQLGGADAAPAVLAAMLVASLLMVSTIRFRSFKDLRFDTGTALLIAFALGSSALVSARWAPGFVVAWLIGAYVLLGVAESLWRLPRTIPRFRAHDEEEFEPQRHREHGGREGREEKETI